MKSDFNCLLLSITPSLYGDDLKYIGATLSANLFVELMVFKHYIGTRHIFNRGILWLRLGLSDVSKNKVFP